LAQHWKLYNRTRRGSDTSSTLSCYVVISKVVLKKCSLTEKSAFRLHTCVCCSVNFCPVPWPSKHLQQGLLPNWDKSTCNIYLDLPLVRHITEEKVCPEVIWQSSFLTAALQVAANRLSGHETFIFIFIFIFCHSYPKKGSLFCLVLQETVPLANTISFGCNDFIGKLAFSTWWVLMFLVEIS